MFLFAYNNKVARPSKGTKWTIKIESQLKRTYFSRSFLAPLFNRATFTRAFESLVKIFIRQDGAENEICQTVTRYTFAKSNNMKMAERAADGTLKERLQLV